MTDLNLTHSGEFMVTLVEGTTDAGVDFVDSYVSDPIFVVDAGRIVLSSAPVEMSRLLNAATRAGLTHEETER
jgi:hypothetical protein